MCTYSLWVKLNISLLSSRKTFVGIFICIMLITIRKVKVKVAQSCLTLYDPMDYIGLLHARILEWVAFLSLLQGIFPTQSLPRCGWILYQLSHEESPRMLVWVAYPFSSIAPRPRNQTGSPALQVGSLPTELSGKPDLGKSVSLWSLVTLSKRIGGIFSFVSFRSVL